MAAAVCLVAANGKDGICDGDSDGEGPRRGFAVSGGKASYACQDEISRLDLVKSMDDLRAFQRHCPFREDEFQGVLSEVEDELAKPMNVRLEFTDIDNEGRVPRQLQITNADILFFFLETLGNATEGCRCIERLLRFAVRPKEQFRTTSGTLF